MRQLLPSDESLESVFSYLVACLMNPTIAWITARGLFGRRRFLLLLPLPIMLIGLAWCGPRVRRADPASWGEPVIVGLGFTAVLPIIALIVGTGVLGSEIDDGTIAAHPDQAAAARARSC